MFAIIRCRIFCLTGCYAKISVSPSIHSLILPSVSPFVHQSVRLSLCQSVYLVISITYILWFLGVYKVLNFYDSFQLVVQHFVIYSIVNFSFCIVYLTKNTPNTEVFFRLQHVPKITFAAAFAKLRKATISSLWLSVCPYGTSRLPLDGLSLNLIFM